MEKVRAVIKYITFNFGPLLTFYLLNHLFGLRIAIGASLLVTIVEIIYFKLKAKQISTFFIFSAIITFVFGALDLLAKEPIFFKFEAGLINLLFAFFFTFSLFQKKPIVQMLAEQQGSDDVPESPDKAFFFRFLTAFWALYYVCKGIAFTWINLNNSVEYGMFIRILVGNISLAVMLYISIGLSEQLWRLLTKLKLMPSTRSTALVSKCK